MEELIKVAAVGIMGCVFVLLLKKDSPVMSFTLAACTAVLLLKVFGGFFGNISEFILSLSDKAGVTPAAVLAVLKTTGIAIITKLTADICKDASQNALSTAVEITGSVISLYVSLPFMESVIDMIYGLM